LLSWKTYRVSTVLALSHAIIRVLQATILLAN
jgi:hypothetical protein